MRSGLLRHRVTIQSRTISQDAYGAPVETWANTFTAWASVDDISAREVIGNRAEMQEVTTLITMRNRATVTPSMRAVWGSRTYDIRGVVRTGKREQMELMCVEAV